MSASPTSAPGPQPTPAPTSSGEGGASVVAISTAPTAAMSNPVPPPATASPVAPVSATPPHAAGAAAAAHAGPLVAAAAVAAAAGASTPIGAISPVEFFFPATSAPLIQHGNFSLTGNDCIALARSVDLLSRCGFTPANDARFGSLLALWTFVHRYQRNALSSKIVLAGQARQLEGQLAHRTGLFTPTMARQLQLQMKAASLVWIDQNSVNSMTQGVVLPNKEIPPPMLDVLRAFTKPAFIKSLNGILDPTIQQTILKERQAMIQGQCMSASSGGVTAALAAAIAAGGGNLASDPAIAFFQSTSLHSLSYPPNAKQIEAIPSLIGAKFVATDVCTLMSEVLYGAHLPSPSMDVRVVKGERDRMVRLQIKARKEEIDMKLHDIRDSADDVGPAPMITPKFGVVPSPNMSLQLTLSHAHSQVRAASNKPPAWMEIDSLALGLVPLQRKMRAKILRALPLDVVLKDAYRSRRDVEANQRVRDKAEKKTRLATEKHLRKTRRNYLNAVTNHARDFQTHHRELHKKLCKTLPAALQKYWEDRARRLQDHEKAQEKTRLALLKQNDEEGYIALLKEAKNERLLNMLAQTDAYMDQLSKQIAQEQAEHVDHAANAAGMNHRPTADGHIPSAGEFMQGDVFSSSTSKWKKTDAELLDEAQEETPEQADRRRLAKIEEEERRALRRKEGGEEQDGEEEKGDAAGPAPAVAITLEAANLAQEAGAANGSASPSVPTQSARKLYYSLAHKKSEEVVTQPKMLKGGQLRSYQLEGLQWLVSLYNNNLNGILADEMGLGKTVQSLALLAYLMEVKHNYGPFLIIVPMSTLHNNWEFECDRWLPGIAKVVYDGDKERRRYLRENFIKPGHFNIVMTTFEFAMRDKATLRKIPWAYMIIDEAHRLKNPACLLFGTLVATHDGRSVPVEQLDPATDLLVGPTGDAVCIEEYANDRTTNEVYTIAMKDAEAYTVTPGHLVTLMWLVGLRTPRVEPPRGTELHETLLIPYSCAATRDVVELRVRFVRPGQQPPARERNEIMVWPQWNSTKVFSFDTAVDGVVRDTQMPVLAMDEVSLECDDDLLRYGERLRDQLNTLAIGELFELPVESLLVTNQSGELVLHPRLRASDGSTPMCAAVLAPTLKRAIAEVSQAAAASSQLASSPIVSIQRKVGGVHRYAFMNVMAIKPMGGEADRRYVLASGVVSHNCKLAQELTTYPKEARRVALTGTPLQNQLHELWSLLSFLQPTLFNSSETFEKWFSTPFDRMPVGAQDKEAHQAMNEEEKLLVINRLHSILRPFLLRRMKVDVATDLVDKIEKVLRCELSPMQKAMYEAVLMGKVTMHNKVMQLRKICIAAGTPVNLSGGTASPIEQLVGLPGVLAYDSHTGGLVPRATSAHLVQGVKPCVELLFSDGRTLTCTPDHPLLCVVMPKTDKREHVSTSKCAHEWRRADELEVGGSFVAAGVEYPSVDVAEASDSTWQLECPSLEQPLNMHSGREQALAFARLLGNQFGRGNAHRLTFAHRFDAEQARTDCITLAGLPAPVVAADRGTDFDLLLPGPIIAALSSIKSPTASLPSFILAADCPQPLVREFLGGLFGSRGRMVCTDDATEAQFGFGALSLALPCTGTAAWTLRTTLLDQLNQLLRRFDPLLSVARCSLTTQGSRSRAIKSSQQLRHSGRYTLRLDLALASTPAFHRHIGFRLASRKQQQLTAACAHLRAHALIESQRRLISQRAHALCQTGQDLLPAVAEAKAQLSRTAVLHQQVATWRPLSVAQLDEPAPRLTPAQSMHLFDTTQFFLPTPPANASTNEASLPLFRVQLVGRRLAGSLPVYDLTVPSAHSFTASGLVVHNCNHPILFHPFLRGQARANAYTPDETLIKMCGKFTLLDQILHKLKRTGHRVLIFNQMTKVMDVLEEYCNMRGFTFLRLDGSTSADVRTESLLKFNAPDSPYFIFMLSTKAGGLGLNLQTADTVILFDSDWNPMNDAQAMARSHRIGQRNQVIVLRFITTSTVEEQVLSTATTKLSHEQMVIQAGMFHNTYNHGASRAIAAEAIAKEAAHTGDTGDDEGDAEVWTDDFISRTLARNDDELGIFQEMDALAKRSEASGSVQRGMPDQRMPKWCWDWCLHGPHSTSVEQGLVPFNEKLLDAARAKIQKANATDPLMPKPRPSKAAIVEVNTSDDDDEYADDDVQAEASGVNDAAMDDDGDRPLNYDEIDEEDAMMGGGPRGSPPAPVAAYMPSSTPSKKGGKKAAGESAPRKRPPSSKRKRDEPTAGGAEGATPTPKRKKDDAPKKSHKKKPTVAAIVPPADDDIDDYQPLSYSDAEDDTYAMSDQTGGGMVTHTLAATSASGLKLVIRGTTPTAAAATAPKKKSTKKAASSASAATPGRNTFSLPLQR